MTERRAALRPRPTWLVAVVVVLQLATLLTYVASGLLAPPYAVVLLLTTWLALTVVAPAPCVGAGRWPSPCRS